jgi:hypothetical protein
MEEKSENVTETTATITAKVNPEGLETHVYLQYGEGPDTGKGEYGQSTAPLNIGAVAGNHEVSFALKGLQFGTPYHFHVVAFNSEGTQESPEAEFKTLKPPPLPPNEKGEKPWWHLNSTERPALHQGNAKNEVQQLTVSATGGSFALQNTVSGALDFFSWDATREELQTGLEGAVYGAHNVEVGGGPSVVGTGNVLRPARGKGKLSLNSATVEEAEASAGAFAVGQRIEGAGIPAGTKIEVVEGEAPSQTLTLSAKAQASASGVQLTVLGSSVVEHVATSFPAGGGFAVGEQLAGPGIPVGTTIEKVEENGSKLTLSQATISQPKRGATPEEPQDDASIAVLAPYALTFTGALADQAVPLVKAYGNFFGVFVLRLPGECGGGFCEGSAAVTETTKAQPDGQLVLTVSNLGDATVLGAASPVKITDTLPPGLRAVSITGRGGEGANKAGDRGPLACPTNSEVQEGKPLTCTFEKYEIEKSNHEKEAVPQVLPPYEHLELVVGVVVEDEALAASGHNQLSVSGGEGYTCQSVGHGKGSFSSRGCMLEENGAGVEGGGGFERALTGPVPSSSLAFPLRFGTPAFGVEAYELTNENAGGEPDTQAGSHPFQQTTTIFFNQTAEAKPIAPPKDVHLKWPAGLVGNPTPLPKCTIAQFLTILSQDRHENACPADTQVGIAVSTVDEVGASTGLLSLPTPLFNLETLKGEPARLGFYVPGAPIFIDPSVRNGEDYGITVNANNITQVEPVLSSQVTVWGVPGEPVHDPERGFGCLGATRGVNQKEEGTPACQPQGQAHPPSFLAMPTACPVNPTTHQPEPLQSIFEADSWAEPGNVVKGSTNEASVSQQPMPALDGCNKLPFEPSIKVKPDTQSASSPSGLTVDVHVPQEESLNAEGLSVADPRTITVALPEGVAVNPAGGDGLGACTEGQIGFNGFSELPTEPGVNGPVFTPGLLEPFCPDDAKIATATIRTPLLPHSLEGSVYLATQNANPLNDSLLAMYIVAEDEASGVQVKLAGSVHLSATGQLTATFEDSPQAPFEDAELHFFGGERAPLATPAQCGAYTTNASFTPWSAAENPTTHEIEPGQIKHSSSTFDITSGPNGGPCTYPGQALPFAPSLTGGTSNINAGGFSPLVTTISRQDGQQNLQQVTLHMPAGLEGLLSNVKLCPESQANEGTCGPESLIGETIVSAGVGSDPVSVKGGRVYLTEKYAGAPFGLSIVNPVKAGPFDLEHDTANSPAQTPPCDCVVVRAKIEVNPVTAELTITTDKEGPHAIPDLIDGIPVQIKAVNVTVNREHFTFNPTNCNPMSLTGSIASDEGAASPVSVPFQATNCAALKYTPTLAVSTAGKASKVNGSSLHFKIAYPKGAMGSQSWMKEMKFTIPKQLPARLTTIQKACLAAVFETNRGACPAASIIGQVLVHTPVLPVPLEGPLYFVSYGGAAFPDAVAVLHGYGLTIESHGHTFIDGKTGVTSATFETVPDVPFESIEVTVPQGKFSEFGANLPKGSLNFCGQKLAMPYLFEAQNGAIINGSAPVGVTGCPKAKTRAQLLAAALKACHKDKNKAKRQSCEKAARKKYGAKASKTQKKKK